MIDDTRPFPLSQPKETSVEQMRAAAATRVEHTSLRGVAREIGMSPTGLKKFLQGTAPYSPTLRRLRKWYIHHAAVPFEKVEKVDASAAITVLTFDLGGQNRVETADCVLDCLGRGYDATGRQRPVWMAELRELLKAS